MAFTFLSFCGHCGAKNRVRAVHLADRGKCGECTSDLVPVDEPLSVNDMEFDEIVNHATVPVMVYFWASWCQPCKAAEPEVRKVAADMEGRGLVLKVDTDANPLLVSRYGVQSIPHIMIFHEGHAAFSRPGFARREEMRTWIEDFLLSSSRH